MKRKLLPVLALSSALVLSACGGDDDNDTVDGSSPGATPTQEDEDVTDDDVTEDDRTEDDHGDRTSESTTEEVTRDNPAGGSSFPGGTYNSDDDWEVTLPESTYTVTEDDGDDDREMTTFTDGAATITVIEFDDDVTEDDRPVKDDLEWFLSDLGVTGAGNFENGGAQNADDDDEAQVFARAFEGDTLYQATKDDDDFVGLMIEGMSADDARKIADTFFLDDLIDD